jgi:hypothetical protein
VSVGAMVTVPFRNRKQRRYLDVERARTETMKTSANFLGKPDAF